MKYFLDTEFIEYPATIDLVSIGIVAEDGREYYAICSEFDESKANTWVKEHVISALDSNQSILRKTRAQIRDDVLSFIEGDEPEFWGYYADYDWVVFCWLFGAMIDLPKGWPMYCRDIKQWCDERGNPPLPCIGQNEHHALSDARWNKAAWEFLQEYGGNMPSSKDTKVKKPMSGSGVKTSYGKDLETIEKETNVKTSNNPSGGRDHEVKQKGGA